MYGHRDLHLTLVEEERIHQLCLDSRWDEMQEFLRERQHEAADSIRARLHRARSLRRA